jgi:soluble lytic murein transglycosylase-like protein
VSNQKSFAAVKSSPRGFAHALLAGGLFIAAAMALQPADFGRSIHDSAQRRPALARLILPAQPVAPSAFDEESTMTPAQLLNRWDGYVNEAAKRFHLPKAWIRAVMARESGGRTMLDENQQMVSRAGAIGLMQVLPETYNEMRAQYRLGDNPFDAHDNILAGAAYLRWLQGKYGYPAMFAAYNAGPGKLEDHLVHGVTLPAETRAYVGGITRALSLRLPSERVALTQPDGATVKIDATSVTAIRAALPGEYAASVKSVLTVGKRKQAIQEDVADATAAIRATGGLI